MSEAPGSRNPGAGDPSAEEGQTLDPLEEDLPGFPALPALGRYQLREELGRGGMGVVYRAVDTSASREVAVKVMAPDPTPSGERARRFHREAKAIAKLDHPSLTRLLDFGQVDGQSFIVMELIEGPTLQALLRQRGPLSPDEALAIAIPLARALHHAHCRGIVHRDVSPKNVLMADGERPLLTDFGIALDFEEGDTMTLTGQVLGTPSYMAPEQAQADRAQIGPATDVYALGAVLYRMVCGAPPRADRASAGDLTPQVQSAPTPAEPPLRELPPGLARICRSALAWRPEARYPSAEAMLTDMVEELRGSGARGVTVSPLLRLSWWASRHRGALGALALALLSVVAIFGALQLRRHLAEEEAEARRLGLEARLDQLEAEGAWEQSDGLLEEFSALYEGQGLRAAPSAWLSHAQRKRARGDREGEIAALVRAYSSDADPEIAQRVLQALVEALYRRERWSSLYTAMRRMRGAEVFRPYELAAALGAGDFPLASTLIAQAPDAAPVLRPLLAGTPTAYRMPPAHAPLSFGTGFKIDVDGDGETELMFSTDEGDLAVVALRPGLPLRFRIPADPAAGFTPAAVLSQGGGQPDLLVVRDQTHRTRLVELTPQGMVTRHSHADAPLWDAASADLDGDGQLEWYGASPLIARRLLQLHPQGEETRLTRPHPATDAAGSDVQHTLSADLDADGQTELVVAVGPWRAYDLRIFQRDRGAPELNLVARERLGHLASLATPALASGERLLVAVKTDAYPSRVFFPPEHPEGAPAGLYTFQWTGQALVRRSFLPASEAAVHDQLLPDTLHCGDLDGDGDEELLGRDSWFRTHLYHHEGDGRWRHLILAGVAPLAVHDLDGDGRAEVIAAVGQRIWVLGDGGTPLPNLVEPGTDVAVAPPPPGEGDLAARWERAEDLASLGLLAQAARIHERIAGLALTDRWRGDANLRAASLMERAGDRGEALRLFKASSGTLSTREAGLEGIARVSLEDHRFDEASEAAAQLVALGSSSSLATGSPGADSQAAKLEIDFSQPLDPRWQINDPTSVRHSEGMLNVAMVGAQGIVAQLPLTFAGGRLAIEVEGELRASDWGSRLMIGLRRPGEAATGVAIHSLGGGRIVHHEPAFYTARQPETKTYARPLAWLSTAGPEALRRAPAPFGYRLDLAGDRGIAEVIDGDGRRWRWVTMEWAEATTGGGGDLELFIGADPHGPPAAYSAAADLGLRHIRLWGVTLAGGSAAPSPNASLANEDPAGALEQLVDTPEVERAAQWWLTQAIALDEAGEGSSTVATALAHMADAPDLEPVEDELLALLRHRHDAFGGPLARALGPAFPSYLYRAWAVALQQHPDDPLAFEVLDRSRRSFSEPASEDAEARAALLLLHARASLYADQTEAGLESARQLEELLRTCEGADHLTEEDAVLTLCALLVKVGAPREAAQRLQSHLDSCPAPEIFRDRLAIDPALASLSGGWKSDPGTAPAHHGRPAAQPQHRQ